MLSPSDHEGRDAQPVITLAHLDGLDLHHAADGWHGIWQMDGVTHQFWLPDETPNAAAFYVVTLQWIRSWNCVPMPPVASGDP
ncbi:hypothetical protein ACT6QH_00170 [Xanthobacter sp. TB0139]|uniref:hypothetical protein n=1 Tax=Xanthobacter sp. TB0139 TaxID=3459178 RepID=UPI004039670F